MEDSGLWSLNGNYDKGRRMRIWLEYDQDMLVMGL